MTKLEITYSQSIPVQSMKNQNKCNRSDTIVKIHLPNISKLNTWHSLHGGVISLYGADSVNSIV